MSARLTPFPQLSTIREVLMPHQTALPASHAIPCLRYDDANAAISWLVDALGAEAIHVYPGPDDTVAHAELWFGDACVMLGSNGVGSLPPVPAGQGAVYVVLRGEAAVDALHDRARAAGARIVIELHDASYGSRDFTCADPEGNTWSFGSYAPSRG